MSKAESKAPETAVEPSREECGMAICAIRYCLGRRSYVVSDGQRWARHYGRLSPWVRDVIARDLEEARDRDQRSGGEWSPFGDPHDKAGWLAVLEDLKAMGDEEGVRDAG